MFAFLTTCQNFFLPEKWAWWKTILKSSCLNVTSTKGKSGGHHFLCVPSDSMQEKTLEK